MVDLEEVKARLRRKFLGQAGIHGFGIRRSQNAVCVYFSTTGEQHEAVLREIKREATPYHVLAIEEPPPRLTRSEDSP